MIDPSTLKYKDIIYYRFSDGLLGSDTFRGIERERIMTEHSTFGISLSDIVSVNQDPMVLDKTFYNSFPASPWNPKQIHCEIQWSENAPWKAATAEYDSYWKMILVKDMRQKKYFVCLDGTSFGSFPKIRPWSEDGKNHKWFWLTTTPNPRSSATGCDAGQRGWKAHLVDVVNDQADNPSLCGIRPPHGWGMDLFIDSLCSRCVKKAEKMNIITNVTWINGIPVTWINGIPLNIKYNDDWLNEQHDSFGQ